MPADPRVDGARSNPGVDQLRVGDDPVLLVGDGRDHMVAAPRPQRGQFGHPNLVTHVEGKRGWAIASTTVDTDVTLPRTETAWVTLIGRLAGHEATVAGGRATEPGTVQTLSRTSLSCCSR